MCFVCLVGFSVYLESDDIKPLYLDQEVIIKRFKEVNETQTMSWNLTYGRVTVIVMKNKMVIKTDWSSLGLNIVD